MNRTFILVALVFSSLAVTSPAVGRVLDRAEIVQTETRDAENRFGPNWRWRYCKFQSLGRVVWSRSEVHKTIHCAIEHFPTSHATADYVADRESDYQHDAWNSSSGACGVYQHLSRYWPGRVDAFNGARPRWDLAGSCKDARANILVTMRMAHGDGWGPWGG